MGNLVSKIVFQPPNTGYTGFSFVKTPDGSEICYSRTDPKRPSSYKEPRDGSIVYFHGNAENIVLLRPTLQEISDYFDTTVFAMDYRGYNKDARERILPDETQFKQDVETFVDNLSLKQKVIVWGRSLGSSAAINAAVALQNKVEISTLILQSGFYSAGKTVLSCIPSSLDIFKNFKDMQSLDPKICKQVLIIHGEDDPTVPSKHAHMMYNLFKKRGFNVEIKILPMHNHNNIDVKDVRSFYEEHANKNSE